MMTAPAYRAHPIKNFFRNEGNRWRRHPASALLRLLCRLSVLITIFALLAIVIDLYGLFGMVFFTALHINLTLLSGALTLSLMVLPLILRTTEEALLSIPDSYREGSFGLGAGKLRTVIKIVLPPAMPGILSGVVLAIGRIVGETAALLFTKSPRSSGRPAAANRRC